MSTSPFAPPFYGIATLLESLGESLLDALLESLGDAYLNSELLPLVDSLAYDSGDTAAKVFLLGYQLPDVRERVLSVVDLAVESAGGLGHLRAGISLVG